MALYQADRASPTLPDKPVVNLPGYDFESTPIYDRGSQRILGYRYEKFLARHLGKGAPPK